MIGEVIDVFRMRQYFDVLVRLRDVARDLADDARLLDDVRRALLPLPGDRWPEPDRRTFPDPLHLPPGELDDRRVGIVATGGSGALASVVGVGRALEEYGIEPAVISICSGSALFGFPLAAGVPAEEIARFMAALRPADYVDPNWPELLRVVPTLGRGFAGIIRGELLEATYRGLLGEMTLGQMPIPAYAPIWNIEHNRVEYLGPATHPDLPVARAVHMAIALPLFLDPVVLDGDHWCDGGIVDIFPVHPVLDLEEPCDLVIGVNGFYPPGFLGEDQTGWERRRFSILDIASQVRTAQQVQLARENLARLAATTEVLMIEPVPYEKVQGAGFYRQFLDTREWGDFMIAGLERAHEVLAEHRSRRAPQEAGRRRPEARMRLNA
jgi:NTE family protein